MRTIEEKRASVRKALHKRRAMLKQLGRCVDCGCHHTVSRGSLCRDCLTDRSERERARRKVEIASSVTEMPTRDGNVCPATITARTKVQTRRSSE
jgi:hypothetical protein